MRYALPALCLVAPLAVGCQPDCLPPQSLNGQRFQVVANPIEHLNAQNLNEFTAHPDYLSYGSPGNGHSEWVIDWGANQSGAVTVSIDGQPFQGRGEWDGIECGRFALTFDGEYRSDDGVRHNFNTSGVFVTYDDHIGGEVLWVQSWVSPDGRAGDWRARVGVRGQRVGSANEE